MKRFWDKVEKTDGCWLWKSAYDNGGYGLFWVNGKTCLAHRVAYELVGNKIPDGLQLDHLCRNRGCVKPSHLEVVTLKENVLRGIGITAKNKVKTHCPKNHPYNETNTLWDKKGRQCRECNRIRRRQWWANRKPVEA